MRTFDAAHPQPKSKAAPIHARDEDDDDDEEDEEEYEEMLAEAGAKRDRLSERLIVSAAAAAASQAATALPPLALNRPDNRRNSYPSPLTEHSFSQDDSDMYWELCSSQLNKIEVKHLQFEFFFDFPLSENFLF